MSNLSQFYGAGFPIGSSLTQVYNGDLITNPDGSQWLATTPTAPFAYTSAYSYLPEPFLSPHPFLLGPENGLFRNPTSPSIAYSPSSGVYCTNTFFGNTGAYYYYTSADGVNWTLRTFPNAIAYNYVFFVAGNFFATASGTTVNGLIYSTDAVTWTNSTIPSFSVTQDIVYNGTNLVLISGTSAAAYSTNLGVTWTSVTLPSTPPNFAFPGVGVITWSQSAGLFLVSSTTSGQYSTSPDGITWTNRNAISSYNSYFNLMSGAVKFASSPSVIVAAGVGGFFLTSTDGLTWTSGAIPGISNNIGCTQLYYDGTRFVARYSFGVYYSTNGTTWIAAKQIGANAGASPYSNGVLFVFCSTTASFLTKAYKVQDVTLTSPQTISVPVAANAAAGVGGTSTYYRIR